MILLFLAWLFKPRRKVKSTPRSFHQRVVDDDIIQGGYR